MIVSPGYMSERFEKLPHWFSVGLAGLWIFNKHADPRLTPWGYILSPLARLCECEI
jgi:hypothetical protein